ncbi:hypothetical protein HDU86_004396 [Geranomyces michiganensis]|nr:hypothetical protein HDU86_004396 [Geranomyces michiganensis]
MPVFSNHSRQPELPSLTMQIPDTHRHSGGGGNHATSGPFSAFPTPGTSPMLSPGKTQGTMPPPPPPTYAGQQQQFNQHDQVNEHHHHHHHHHKSPVMAPVGSVPFFYSVPRPRMQHEQPGFHGPTPQQQHGEYRPALHQQQQQHQQYSDARPEYVMQDFAEPFATGVSPASPATSSSVEPPTPGRRQGPSAVAGRETQAAPPVHSYLGGGPSMTTAFVPAPQFQQHRPPQQSLQLRTQQQHQIRHPHQHHIIQHPSQQPQHQQHIQHNFDSSRPVIYAPQHQPQFAQQPQHHHQPSSQQFVAPPPPPPPPPQHYYAPYPAYYQADNSGPVPHSHVTHAHAVAYHPYAAPQPYIIANSRLAMGGVGVPKKPAKIWMCPTPSCTKQYKNQNGLRYHMSHGACEMDAEMVAGGGPSSDPVGFAGVPGAESATHAAKLALADLTAKSVVVTTRPYFCKVRLIRQATWK